VVVVSGNSFAEIVKYFVISICCMRAACLWYVFVKNDITLTSIIC